MKTPVYQVVTLSLYLEKTTVIFSLKFAFFISAYYNYNDMKSIKTIISKKAIIPALIYFLIVPSYFLVRIFTKNLQHYDLSCPLDELIPFVPAFIWIYVFAYLQWLLGYLAMAHLDEGILRTHMASEVIGKLACVVIFILLPTTIIRPEITGTAPTDAMLSYIYSADQPDNLLPSIHCMESWIVARGLMKTKAPKLAKLLMWCFTVLVCLSVVFVKQHVVLDIPCGILVAELAILLSKRLNAPRIYSSIEKLIGIG